MKLRLLVPTLREHFANAASILQAFENAGFRTSYDLLFGGPPEMLFSKLPHGTISYSGLQYFLEQVATATAAHGLAGDVVLEEEQNIKSAQFGGETGVLELDEMAAGAFGAYGVTEVSGSAASRLVLWIVVRHLAQYGESSALWIDTSYDFSIDQAVLALQSIPFKDAATALDRLQVSRSLELSEVYDALDALQNAITTLAQTNSYRPSTIRYVVISPINAIFSQLLSGTSSQGHAILSTFMHRLSALARSFRLTFLVVNSVVASQGQNPLSAFPSTITKPGLGPTFTFLCENTIWTAAADSIFPDGDEALTILRDENPNCRVFVAECFRSRNQMSRTWCPFAIRNGSVIEAVDWPAKEDDEAPIEEGGM
ncbi:hypothetical protein M407DRAFT_16694 [Tulasnella calospora MUT 4182]|uniref:Rad51-like C-terminal domain-containing protein n=1 Tax=Tulasnella calospora MUT 4182 TaxID=1051891 RepID=A0A0C3MM32_9AGAM|nr:hypothetical protein M407DRAFT_16694 [Tulasnella calospora MUT 4182]